MSQKDKNENERNPSETPENSSSSESQPRDILNLKSNFSFGSIIDCLLKSPETILAELQEGKLRPIGMRLAFTAIICLAAFGFILGLFSGGQQLWASPAKITAGVILSGMITLPSLYIFSCLNGLDVGLKSVFGMMLSSLTLMGLLLLGFAPVSWIFSQSTTSEGFMGFLTLSFWLISLSFGLALMFRAAKNKGVVQLGYLKIWTAIFVLVTLQMSTSLRPIIGKAEESFLPTEKKFFLQHWTGDWFENS